MQEDTLTKKGFVDSNTLSIYQNRALFCISILSSITCLHYNYTKSPYIITINAILIPVYAFIEMFFITNKLSKLHHVYVISICIYAYVNKINLQDTDVVLINYIFCKTEISTICLVFKNWLDKNTLLYKINGIFFYLLFLKIRVIDYYSVICPGSPVYIIDKKYSKNNYMSLMVFSSLYGLYALYIYWFIQINIIFYKQFFAKSIENKSKTSRICGVQRT
jgi:hypothetical protein